MKGIQMNYDLLDFHACWQALHYKTIRNGTETEVIRRWLFKNLTKNQFAYLLQES